MEVENIKKIYTENGQGHVFRFWSDLDEKMKEEYLKELKLYKNDLERLNEIFKMSMMERPQEEEIISPPLEKSVCVLSEKEKEEMFAKGLELIKEGTVGAILLSGGQGTRLGCEKPKGMYPGLGLPSQKTLFEIQAERILSLQKLSCGGVIQWYIMTSGSTNDDVVAFFKEKKFFGLNESQIHIFQQGEFPCFSVGGQFLLSEKGKLSTAPNGNGAMYEALLRSGMLDDMKERGVRYLHMYCVDNILVRVCDPTFIAKCVEQQVDFGSKTIPKRSPHERVGVFALKNQKYHVVEYSEISKEMAEQKKEGTNELLFNESNIVNFFFTQQFLDQCAKMDLKEYHVAKKEIPCLDDTEGKTIKKHGIKLELFNFDICKFTDKICLYRGARNEDFSPLKNAPGAEQCTPQTCVEDLSNLNKQYIQKAGGVLKGEGICEISPLISYQGENLEKHVKGKTIQLPFLLQ